MASLWWDPRAMKEYFLPLLRRNHLAGLAPAPPPPDPREAAAYVDEGWKLLQHKLLRPALTYAQAALFFDPDSPQAARLHQEVLAAVAAARPAATP